ncbi:MAG: T9SS type A sorting domain-containing protein [Ignavibacteriales bacterium]|nr:T9SS type A sorting domain-containing protein [Ignavibacteriales bacterium]
MSRSALNILIIILLHNFNYKAQNIQITDGWYFIDNNKFFIKGIGYETHTRPGQVPWIYSFNADLIREDLQRIKDAGFNTIRTWGALKEEELKLVEESGLKMLFGIWIDPQGNFGDQSFQTASLNLVNEVLSYSKKYDCIIGYLIMNEPQVAHIYDSGSQNLLDLWNAVIELIHQKHPGVPVSFSNTMIGDFIKMDLFDFAAYNAYIYNPTTLTHSHGYAGYLHYLKNNRAPNKPFVVTEFGLSVSPGTASNQYGYGGNTLKQQSDGDLFMYRELIDAGAQGGTVFQYHDGWWKSGNEYYHDSNAEEWFGLIEFASLNDQYGTPRPVWYSFKKYNKAIITDPKNEQIIKGAIPIEIFTTEDVAAFSIVLNNNILINQKVYKSYYKGELNLSLNDEIKDLQLNFYFYNSNGDTLKSEMISVLLCKDTVSLPTIDLQIIPTNLNPGAKNYLLMNLTNNPLFTILNNKVDYIVHPHIGFDPGASKYRIIQLTNNKYNFSDNFDIPLNTKVATFGTGFTIQYGTFQKRITAQKILTQGSWADPILATDIITDISELNNEIKKLDTGFELFHNFPDPFNSSTKIRYTISDQQYATLKVYDILGDEIETLVNEEKLVGSYEVEFDGSKLSSGIYFYQLKAGSFTQTRKMIILK